MSKKILVAAGLYPPDIGGPATYAQMIEERLPTRQINVEVLAFGRVRHLPKIFRHLAYARQLYKQADSCDLIYALDAVSVGLPALLVAKLKNKPLLIRLGGDYAWEQGSQRFGLKVNLDEYTKNRSVASLPVKFLAFIQDFVVSRATKVIVPSEYLKKIVATWRGVKVEHLTVIYSALFPLKVTDTKDDLRAQLNYKGLVIVSAGRLVPWKGFSMLLEVVAQLAKDIPAITLVIAGDGPQRANLEKLTTHLGINDKVRFVGTLSKEALGASIKAADIFILNTSYEGLSHQLLEVMDLNVPIITTAVGGNIELIKDGHTGLLVSFNNKDQLEEAILKLAHNPELATNLADQAKNKVTDFLPDKVMVKLVDGINDVLR
jgi:glycosyltransferase involved in cell wall biosynthesis